MNDRAFQEIVARLAAWNVENKVLQRAQYQHWGRNTRFDVGTSTLCLEECTSGGGAKGLWREQSPVGITILGKHNLASCERGDPIETPKKTFYHAWEGRLGRQPMGCEYDRMSRRKIKHSTQPLHPVWFIIAACPLWTAFLHKGYTKYVCPRGGGGLNS